MLDKDKLLTKYKSMYVFKSLPWLVIETINIFFLSQYCAQKYLVCNEPIWDHFSSLLIIMSSSSLQKFVKEVIHIILERRYISPHYYLINDIISDNFLVDFSVTFSLKNEKLFIIGEEERKALSWISKKSSKKN